MTSSGSTWARVAGWVARLIRPQRSRRACSRGLVRAPVADVAKAEDSPERTLEAARDLLPAHPDIAAIYNVASGNRGLAEALEGADRAVSAFVVTHEANAITVPLVRRGLFHFLIAQDPALMLETAMRLVRQRAAEKRAEIRMLDFAVYTKFNLPRFAVEGPEGRVR
jgi:LacI family transcriptional regulator